jgi:endonuclease YncB( thermonuclease family)
MVMTRRFFAAPVCVAILATAGCSTGSSSTGSSPTGPPASTGQTVPAQAEAGRPDAVGTDAVAAGTVEVVQVIDGDTIEVSDGSRVRLIGIDTPERGACGWSQAGAALEAFVAGRAVTLVAGAANDTDRYGRLLRYVDVDGTDINLEMVRSGLAIARYDSRDGYGAHPRQQTYIDADRDTPSSNVCPDGTGTSTDSTSEVDADPRFATCREAAAAGYGPYLDGTDIEYAWYGDGDGDGVVCE